MTTTTPPTARSVDAIWHVIRLIGNGRHGAAAIKMQALDPDGSWHPIVCRNEGIPEPTPATMLAALVRWGEDAWDAWKASQDGVD